MLKKLVKILLIVGFVTTVQGWEFPEVIKPIAEQLLEACSKKTGVSKELVIKVRSESKFPDVGSAEEAQMKKYVYCTFETANLLNDKHEAALDKALNAFPEEIAVLHRDTMKKCDGQPGGSEMENPYNTVVCYSKNNAENFFLL